MTLAHPPHRSELEAVVRRLVLDALRQSTPSPRGAAQPMEIGTHAISNPVVSLGVLEALPEGVRQVEIAPRAVLTPAAADLLREQEIRVVRGKTARPQGTSADPLPETAMGWIADADDPERAAAYVRQLAHRGLTTRAEQLPVGRAPVRPVGVVIAAVPAVHVDHFARVASLPSAAVGSIGEVGKIAAVMKPAVWVLDGDRLSFSGRIAVAAECFRLSPPTSDSTNLRRSR